MSVCTTIAAAYLIISINGKAITSVPQPSWQQCAQQANKINETFARHSMCVLGDTKAGSAASRNGP